MTMTFVVMGLGTVFNALTNRRDPASGLTAPILQALGVSLVPVALIVLATQLPVCSTACSPPRSPGRSGWTAIGLALVLPIVIEVEQMDPPPACAGGRRWTIERAVAPVTRSSHARAPTVTRTHDPERAAEAETED